MASISDSGPSDLLADDLPSTNLATDTILLDGATSVMNAYGYNLRRAWISLALTNTLPLS